MATPPEDRPTGEELEAVIESLVAELVWPRHRQHTEPYEIILNWRDNWPEENREWLNGALAGAATRMLIEVTRYMLLDGEDDALSTETKLFVQKYLTSLNDRAAMNRFADRID